MTLRASLAVMPVPSGPMWNTHDEKSSRTGRMRRTALSSPPTMDTTPLVTATSPPVTPQSSRVTPGTPGSLCYQERRDADGLRTTTRGSPRRLHEAARSPDTSRTWASSTTTTRTTSHAAATSPRRGGDDGAGRKVLGRLRPHVVDGKWAAGPDQAGGDGPSHRPEAYDADPGHVASPATPVLPPSRRFP